MSERQEPLFPERRMTLDRRQLDSEFFEGLDRRRHERRGKRRAAANPGAANQTKDPVRDRSRHA